MSAEPFIAFDPANYLDDIDDAALYLQVALEESGDDPTAGPRAMGVIARSGVGKWLGIRMTPPTEGAPAPARPARQDPTQRKASP